MQLAAFSKLMGHSALIFACRLSGAVAVFATQLLLARWMGAEGLGIYVLAFSWSLMLSTVAGLGYPAASLRFIGENLGKNQQGQLKGFISHSRKTVLLSSVGTSLVAVTTIVATQSWMPDGYVWPLVAAMACVPLITIQRLHDKFANAFSWFALAFAPSMAARPILFLAVITVLWFLSVELTATTAMAWQFAAIAIVVIIQQALLQPKLQAELGAGEAEFGKQLWARTAIPLLMSTLFVQYFPELTVILLGFLLPAADVAVFYTCFRIALFIGFALTAVNALLTPQVSKLYAEQNIEALQKAVTTTTRLKFAGAALAIILLMLFGKTILGWFGTEFVSGYPVLLLLAGGQLILAAFGPVDILLNLTGHQKHCLMAFSIALVVAVILNLILVPIIGLVGAALTALLTIAFWNIWLLTVVTRKLGIRPSILAF